MSFHAHLQDVYGLLQVCADFILAGEVDGGLDVFGDVSFADGEDDSAGAFWGGAFSDEWHAAEFFVAGDAAEGL